MLLAYNTHQYSFRMLHYYYKLHILLYGENTENIGLGWRLSSSHFRIEYILLMRCNEHNRLDLMGKGYTQSWSQIDKILTDMRYKESLLHNFDSC